MAVTIEAVDITGRSWFTKGISNRRYDRAMRVFRVSGLNNYGPLAGNQDYIDAINAITAQYGVFHHNDVTLPLRTTTVRKIGTNKCEVHCEYGRGSWSVPTAPAHTLAQYRVVSAPVEWYRRKFGIDGGIQLGNGGTGIDGAPIPVGTPDGVLHFLAAGDQYDPAAVPRAWIWDRPALQMSIPTVLDFNPIPRVFPSLDTINGDTIKFGGYRFAPYTVRLDGLSVTAEQQSGGNVLYGVWYHFTCVRTGWWNQMAYFDTANAPPGGSGQWRTRCGLAYETTNYAGRFPIHA